MHDAGMDTAPETAPVDDPLDAATLPAMPAPRSPVADLLASGATFAQVADALGISVHDVAAQAPADFIGPAHVARVADALYASAVGYEYDEERATAAGVVTVRRVMPPDPKAAALLLERRDPDRWADDRRVTVNNYVALLPPVAANATEWLASLARPVIEHAPGVGGGSVGDGGSGAESSRGTTPRCLPDFSGPAPAPVSPQTPVGTNPHGSPPPPVSDRDPS